MKVALLLLFSSFARAQTLASHSAPCHQKCAVPPGVQYASLGCTITGNCKQPNTSGSGRITVWTSSYAWVACPAGAAYLEADADVQYPSVPVNYGLMAYAESHADMGYPRSIYVNDDCRYKVAYNSGDASYTCPGGLGQ